MKKHKFWLEYNDIVNDDNEDKWLSRMNDFFDTVEKDNPFLTRTNGDGSCTEYEIEESDIDKLYIDISSREMDSIIERLKHEIEA